MAEDLNPRRIAFQSLHQLQHTITSIQQVFVLGDYGSEMDMWGDLIIGLDEVTANVAILRLMAEAEIRAAQREDED